jgi:beta-galactosidase
MVNAQSSRTKIAINDSWLFLNEGIAFGQNSSLVDDTSWEKVNVPHTWNAVDPFDAHTSYKRGIAWYRKSMKISTENRTDKKSYLQFEGVNQVADVYVNGIHVGRHKGGYTAFTFDITEALNEEEDQLIAVMVNNAHDPYIAPLSVGFALYGGIYRDVWLVTTNNIHFDMDNYGSNSVFISTPTVNDAQAKVTVKGTIVNEEKIARTLEVNSVIYDALKNEVGSVVSEINLKAGEKLEYTHDLTVDAPKLWSPDNPYLYAVKSTISKNKKVIDVLENPLGLRWFSFDAKSGFSLNGKIIKLRGTNRHQDKMGQGSALTNVEHRRDMQLIKDMGCNFIRIAHYPQDPEILKAADELGLLAWEEVPLVNYMTIHPEFLENSKVMLKEMIRQHYNHPSVIVWGSMNEIFLWGNNEARVSNQTDDNYTKKVTEFTKILDATIREEDPFRYTTLAMHMSSDYDKVGIEDIPQIAAYNVYSGWYSDEFNDLGKSMDKKNESKPNQVIFISEYGAGSDMELNSDKPKRFDFTGQYQRLFNESYLKQIEERHFISGSAIWNQFDFSQPDVGGSMPYLNQKGMLTWDRKPKDVYYLFQANWSKKPMVHIAEKDWPVRAITGDSKKYTITIYSNLNEINLFHNGTKVGTKPIEKLNKVQFEVVLEKGENQLKATGVSNGKTLENNTQVTLQKYLEKNDSSIFINVGSNAQYFDTVSNTAWIEDNPFNGYYGYVGGEEKQLNRKSIIRNNRYNPLYYSAIEGANSYKIKVKNGKYMLSLYLMEFNEIAQGERVFDVFVNENKVISALDLTKEAGFCYGIEKIFEVEVTNNEVLIELKSIKGKTILSGLQLNQMN